MLMIAMPSASAPNRSTARAASASGSNTCRVPAEYFATVAAGKTVALANSAKSSICFSASLSAP